MQGNFLRFSKSEVDGSSAVIGKPLAEAEMTREHRVVVSVNRRCYDQSI